MAKRFDQEAVRKIFVELIANYMTETDTKKEITSQIAAIVANAPESLDTLQKIAEWIENHTQEAEKMNTKINDNANDIDDLKKLVKELEGAEANVIEEIDVNGVKQTVTDKKVDLSVPEKTSELENDSSYISAEFVDDTLYIGSAKYNFCYIENQETIVFSEDSGLEYDEDAQTIYYDDDTDDFGYDDDTESMYFECGTFSAETKTVSSVINLDSGITYLIYDAEAHKNIEALEKSLQELEASVEIIKSDIPTALSDLKDDVGYAKVSDIPTKTSDLENDSDFVTFDYDEDSETIYI